MPGNFNELFPRAVRRSDSNSAVTGLGGILGNNDLQRAWPRLPVQNCSRSRDAASQQSYGDV
ncbi:hypothetical protein DXU04_23385 [Bradyrhizobium diazoefficiens]